jgi:hypothetical protein
MGIDEEMERVNSRHPSQTPNAKSGPAQKEHMDPSAHLPTPQDSIQQA